MLHFTFKEAASSKLAFTFGYPNFGKNREMCYITHFWSKTRSSRSTLIPTGIHREHSTLRYTTWCYAVYTFTGNSITSSKTTAQPW